jgi:uncharacterized damage-inducible protein DinB
MQVNKEKEDFLLNEFILLIKTIDEDQEPVWGKMSVHQMVEHMTDSIRIANEKNKEEKIVTPAERLDASYQFMMSDKLFKENTKNILMAEEPPPTRNEFLEDAILELDNEIADFHTFFKDDPEKRTTNPFFGYLNYAEWVQLLHKHAMHHLRQFSAI